MALFNIVKESFKAFRGCPAENVVNLKENRNLQEKWYRVFQLTFFEQIKHSMSHQRLDNLCVYLLKIVQQTLTTIFIKIDQGPKDCKNLQLSRIRKEIRLVC